MKELTGRQREVLEFIRGHADERGYPPTVREIGEHFGILWPAARAHLKSLEKKGVIKMLPSKSRGIEIVGLQQGKGVSVPVAGEIRAGRPLLAVENIEGHIIVDKTLFPAEGSFSLKVTGDSMIDAGIFDGDYVIVKPQSTIENGEIGVVLINDEATVKRVFKSKDKITLKPENRALQPVTYDAGEVTVLGKVAGVIRKI